MLYSSELFIVYHIYSDLWPEYCFSGSQHHFLNSKMAFMNGLQSSVVKLFRYNESVAFE